MEIESGIPLPALQVARSELGRLARRMEIGQSVLCADMDEALKMREAIRSAKGKAALRAQPGGRYRVWRVA